MMHPKTVWHIELPGAVSGQAHGAGTAAVVGIPQGDHVVVLRIGPGHQDREIIGLRPAVHEINHLQIPRHFFRQGGGVNRKIRVQVNGAGVLKQSVLRIGSRHDPGMAMPNAHRDNTGESIQIAAAGFVVKILPLSLHNHDGLLVIMEEGRIDGRFPQGMNLGQARAGVWRGNVGEGGKLREAHRDVTTGVVRRDQFPVRRRGRFSGGSDKG